MNAEKAADTEPVELSGVRYSSGVSGEIMKSALKECVLGDMVSDGRRLGGSFAGRLAICQSLERSIALGKRRKLKGKRAGQASRLSMASADSGSMSC